MRAFIDTSSLFKKYHDEPGSDRLDTILDDVNELIISPITPLEFRHIVRRLSHQKTLSSAQASKLLNWFKIDLPHFSRVRFDAALEETCSILLYGRIAIRPYLLHSIQLASALLAQPDIFLTSDRSLAKVAGKKVEVVLI